jgi:hypothetical protein
MTDYEAMTAIYGVAQPLIIQWVAGKKHGFWKWLVILSLSLCSGFALYYLEYGMVTSQTWVQWIMTSLKILAYSLGSWGALWKKIFPDKSNPLDPNAKKQAKKVPAETEYEIKMDYEGHVYGDTVKDKTLKGAVRRFMDNLQMN